jgi:hypothetical protein
LLALLLSGNDLGMIAIIGIILLIGIVKKNAIMMIDFALEAERHQGMSPRDAIYQAALLRFRPILMTTLAALFGAVPLMLATGSGAELRQPLGLVMVGGLLVSQVLTLFTTPVIYLYFDRLAAAGAQRLTHSRPTHEPVRSFHPPPGGDHAAEPGDHAAGRGELRPVAGVAAAADGLPGDRGAGQPARRQPRGHGLHRGHAAGAQARAIAGVTT